MDKLVVIGIIIGIIGVAGFALASELGKTTGEDIPAKQSTVISSFEDCAAAGFPVMESHPRQCRDADGNLFVEEIPIPVDFMITEVIDGDTLKVNGESIRFALASAPEMNQAGGVEAREFILNLCPPGTFVSVDEDSGQPEGSYGRAIAVIHCNGLNLNAELLDAGLGELSTEFCRVSEFANDAWAQKHGCGNMESNCEIACLVYDPVCGADGITYACGEVEAQCNKVEILHDGECKAVSSSQIEQANCDPSYPDVCIPVYPPDLDCGEITFKNFRVTGSDPHRFDGDGDGVGCER